MLMTCVLLVTTGMLPVGFEDGNSLESLAVVSKWGDTALGYYYNLEIDEEIPRSEWLARFADLNGIPNTDQAFRRLPAQAIWRLPVASSPSVSEFEALEPMSLELKFAPSEVPSEHRWPVKLSPMTPTKPVEVKTVMIESIEAPVADVTLTEAAMVNVATVQVDQPTEPRKAQTPIAVPVLSALLLIFFLLALRYWLALERCREAYQKEVSDLRLERERILVRLAEVDELRARNEDQAEFISTLGYWYDLPKGLIGVNGEERIFLKYAGRDQHLKKVSERRVYLENCEEALAVQIAKVEKHLWADPLKYGLELLMGSAPTAEAELLVV